MTRTFATMVLALSGAGTALAAGGTYDEEDPFKERERIAHFRALGGDLTTEVDIEFLFFFRDRAETRTEHAQSFALKLSRLGYPGAKAEPCSRPTDCWFVAAPKRMRIDEKKLIPLSKELDQLAADDYGRYGGWDSAQLRREAAEIQALADSVGAAPTVGKLLEAFEQFGTLQCNRTRATMERDAEQASAAGKLHEAYGTRRMLEMICTCMPERARQIRTDLTPAERDAAITEVEFTQRYAPGIIQPCAAGMMRKMYGEDCPQIAAAYKVGATYCPCMRGLVDSMTEAEIAQLGLESSDYTPRAAEAKKAGRSEPEKPPILRQFMEKEAACRR